MKSPIVTKRDMLINGMVDAIMKKVKTGLTRQRVHETVRRFMISRSKLNLDREDIREILKLINKSSKADSNDNQSVSFYGSM